MFCQHGGMRGSVHQDGHYGQRKVPVSGFRSAPEEQVGVHTLCLRCVFILNLELDIWVLSPNCIKGNLNEVASFVSQTLLCKLKNSVSKHHSLVRLT